MKFFDIADGTSFDELIGEAPTVAGMTLIPHLRDHGLVFGVGGGQQLGFTDRPAERLLRVAVDPHGDRRHRRCVVGVVGSGDENHVELFGVVFKQLAPIRVAFGLAPALLLVNALPASLVDLGEADALESVFVSSTGMSAGAAADGDEAHLKLTVLVLSAQNVGEGQGRCSAEACRA